jgi:hypothetical protein
MHKPTLLAAILAQLDRELERYLHGAAAARSAATDGESRAENKYDTRGLEASYLAHGQSMQARETLAARTLYAALSPRAFTAEEPIAVGALVALDGSGERLWYFLGPAAGGREVLHEDREIMLVTPSSPLGRELLGKKLGSPVRLGTADFVVAAVA